MPAFGRREPLEQIHLDLTDLAPGAEAGESRGEIAIFDSTGTARKDVAPEAMTFERGSEAADRPAARRPR